MFLSLTKGSGRAALLAGSSALTLMVALASPSASAACVSPVTANCTNSANITAGIGLTSTGTFTTLINNGTITGTQIGIKNTGSIATLSNSGRLVSNKSAAFFNNGGSIGTIINTASGLILDTTIGGGQGIHVNTGSIGLIENQGSIAAYAGIYLDSAGSVDTIDNSGTINAAQLGISNTPGFTLGTLRNSGLISGSSGVFNNGTVGTITNSGTIIGNGTGLAGSGAGFSNQNKLGTLINTGKIQGNALAGVDNAGSIGLLNNSGTITAIGTTAGLHNTGTITTLINSGTILSASHDAFDNGGTTGTLSNSGLISGVRAISISNTGAIGGIGNTGTIAGDIVNSAATALSITGGSGAIFGTLTGASGVGTITSTNLVLASGNLLLHDNVTGTVTSGATLSLTSPITISGNYVQSAGALVINAPTGTTGYGYLTVSGNAAVSSSVITISGAGLAAGEVFTIVQATGTGTYSGDTVSIVGASGLVGTTTVVGHNLLVDLAAPAPCNGAISASCTNSASIGSISVAGSIGYFKNTSIVSTSHTAISVAGTVGTLTNSGTISGTGNGISNTGAIGTLTNSGTIHGAASANAITSTGSIGLLTNSGLITSDGGAAINGPGTIGTVLNAGTIVGPYGINLQGSGSIGLLVNSIGGTISGTAGGPSGAVVLGGSTLGSLSNSGLITGPNALLITLGGSIGPITNAGTMFGNIDNESSNALTIIGGSGGVFGTLTGGSIINTMSNLVFASGNQQLDDDIDATGHSVSNLGASLRLAASHTITGGYSQSAGALAVGANSLTVTSIANISGGTVSGTAASATGNYVAGTAVQILVAGGPGSSYSGETVSETSVTGLSSIGTVSGTNLVVMALNDYVGGSTTSIGNTGNLSIATNAINALDVVSTGSLGTFVNTGTLNISGTNISISAAVNVAGTIGSLSNSGTILGITPILMSGSGSIRTLVNSNQIGAIGDINGIVLTGTAKIGTLSNTGAIIGYSGSAATIGGIDNAISVATSGNSIGTLNNAAGGTILGISGVSNQGTISSLINAGTISGTAGSGVGVGNNSGGVLSSLNNSGVIIGVSKAVNNNGTLTALTNSGLITSPKYAIFSDHTLGPITNTGTIAGSISSSAGNLTISGGTGSTVGTLTGYTNTIGTITNTSSNLVLASGNLLLNDQVNVTGHTVTSGATLSLINPITVTGNFAQTNGGLVINAPSGTTGYGYLTVTSNAAINNALITISGTGLSAGEEFTIVRAGSGSYSGDTAVVTGTSGLTATTTVVGNNLLVDLAALNSCNGVISASCTNSVSIGSIAVHNGTSIGFFTNTGTIFSNATAPVSISGTVGTLTNSGTVSSTGHPGVSITSTGSIGTLNNSAAGTIGGANTSVVIDGGIVDTLTNAGLISKGVLSVAGAMTLLNNSGTISASSGSVILNQGGSIGTLTNSGTISFASGKAIENTLGNQITPSQGTIGLLNNSGMISGSIGINNAAGNTIVSLINSGTIRSNATTAIVNGGSIGGITNTGVVAGDVVNSGNALTISGGTGTTFGTLTGSTGINSIGTIRSGSADLVLASGNLLLNDNIVATGHTVTSGATLSLVNPITVTGNFAQTNGGLVINAPSGTTGYGYLTVTSNAAINNALITISGTGLSAGEEFTIVRAGSGSYSGDTAVVTGTSGLTATTTVVGNNLLVDLAALNSCNGVISASCTNSISIGSIAVNNGTSIGFFTNTGTIFSNAAVPVSIGGTVGTLTNAGTITSDTQIGLSIASSGYVGTLVNSAGATIGAGTLSGHSTSVRIEGGVGVLTNSGLLAKGLINLNGGIGLLTNAGNFTAPVGTALINQGGTIGTLINSGVLSLPSGIAIINELGNQATPLHATIGTFSNSGTITGVTGIYNSIGGTIGTLSNSGTISGSANAIKNQDAILGAIANSGVIAGNISSSQALTIAGGTGSTFGTLTGFGGAVGTIGSTIANLALSSGNLLLNDQINVGSHTVTSGATLSLVNPITITGSYAQTAGGLVINAPTGTTGYGYLTVTSNAAVNNALITIAGTGLSAGEEFTIVRAGSGSYSGDTAVVSGTSGLTATTTVVGNNLLVDLAAANSCAGAITASCTNAISIGSISVAGGTSIGHFTNSGTISNAASTALGVAGTVGTLTNSGTITATGSNGLNNTGTIQTLANNAGGTISGHSSGLQNNGTIQTLTNAGILSADRFSGLDNAGSIGLLINSSGGTIAGGIASAAALANGGSIGSILNSGLISSPSTALMNSGSIGLLSNSGTISGGTIGVKNSGTIGSIGNSGLISGSNSAGIYNSGTAGTIANNAGGTLSGVGYAGLSNFGSVGTLVNAGLITATGNTAAISNASTGSIGTLTNSGTVTGTLGIYNSSGTIGLLSNSGTLQGSGANGALLNRGPLGLLSNTGLIAGNIVNLAAATLTISGGSGAGFGTLTGFGDTIGTIKSTSSNVALSGNLQLNDNINVGSSHTVTSGANLSLANPLTITGNYIQSSGSLLINATGGTASYGQLTVSGNASVSNTAITIAGTGLAAGEIFTIVSPGGGTDLYSGDTAVVTGASGLTASVSTIGNNLLVSLATTPTPTPPPTASPTPTPTPTVSPTPTPTTAPGGTITNTNTITSGTKIGISIGNSITQVTNTGTITSSGGGSITGSGGAVANTGLVTNFTNSGTIIGQGGATIGGVGLFSGSGNSVTNISNGSGGLIAANTAAIQNQGGVGTLGNAGTVMSKAPTGVVNLAGGAIGTLSNSGAISGLDAGVNNKGSIQSLANSGSIASQGAGSVTGNNGAVANSGFVANFSNSGQISGQGGATIGGVGLFSSGSIGALSNAAGGVISGNTAAIQNQGGVGTLGNAGTVTSKAPTGVLNLAGATIGTLSNTGSISGAGVALKNQGSIGIITNAGAILDAPSGTMNSIVGGVANQGLIANFTNSGKITGTGGAATAGAGLQNASSIAQLANLTTGIIGGNTAGVTNQGSITALSNAGIITSAAATGLSNAGTILSLSNSGVIAGTSLGIANSGVIGGNGVTAIHVTATGSIGAIANSGKIVGNIVNDGASPLVIDGGAGSEFGQLMAGSIVSHAGLAMNTGNIALYDNIDVGSATVNVTNARIALARAQSITGNYIQTGGVLQLNLANASQYGSLFVSGKATITGTDFQLSGATFKTGQKIALVTAAGGGTYGSDTVELLGGGSLAPILTFSDQVLYASLPSYRLVGEAVDKIGGQIGGTLDHLAAEATRPAYLDKIDALPANLQGLAIRQMAPDQIAPSSLIASGAGMAMGAVSRHPQLVEDAPHGTALWGQLLNGGDSRNTADDAEGYRSSSFGFSTGFETALAKNDTAGAAFSWVHGWASGQAVASGQSLDADSYFITLYDGFRRDGLFVNAQASFGWNSFNERRAMGYLGQVASAKYDGQSYMGRLDAGYDFDLGGVTLTPIAGITALRVNANSYSETGSAAALSVDANGVNDITHDIGARIAWNWGTPFGTFTPELKAEWLHDYTHAPIWTTGLLGDQGFAVSSARPGQDGLRLGYGVNLDKSKDFSLRIDGQSDLRSNYQSHSAVLKVILGF